MRWTAGRWLGWMAASSLACWGGVACQGRNAGSLVEELDPGVSRLFALDLAPGMAVAAVRGDDLLYLRGFGFADLEAERPVTPETVFYIASSTKAFTAQAAAILHSRGDLDLDAPLSRYLPDLRLQSPLSPDDITLRDLLTHTHGISGTGPVVFRTAYSGVYTPDLLVELLARHGPAGTGRAFNYGNIGYNVASLAMDAALGTSWKDVLQREIFEPLGMENTTAYMSRTDQNQLAMPYAAEEQGSRRLRFVKGDANMHAAGGLVSTAADLAIWLEVNVNEGRVGGAQLLSYQPLMENHRQQADQDREFGEYHRHGWTLGWDIGTYEGDTLIHRFGSFPGFRSHMSFMPEHGIGVAVLVNEAALGGILADQVANYIYDWVLEKPGLEQKWAAKIDALRARAEEGRRRIAADRARRAARPQTLPHPLEAYAGAYENDELGRMEWRVVNGELEVSMGLLESAVEVFNGAENQLRVELLGTGQVVEFAFEGDEARSLRYMGREFARVGAAQ
jgi:CubicO group peptidase (beta-lactamase class C family)